MSDGRVGCITTAKHRSKELDNQTKPAHSAPYRANLKTREFENAELEEMLKQQDIDPEQTESAAPIVLAPRKDGTI